MKRFSLLSALLIRARLALFVERRYSRSLEAQLEGEKQRNQTREDELASSGLRLAGLYGLAPRDSPAQPRESLRRQSGRQSTRNRIVQADPWANLTEEEAMEWPSYQQDALDHNVDLPTARREFIQTIEMRRAGEEVM